ncbi:MAG TPA: sugar porter family MFS transporter [Blastocatellia bacterium]|nr:sugar porter family MFS transporter [Blastocatellia bacterium]
MQTQHIAQRTVTAQHATGTTFVYVAAVFAALGGLLFGYDTGVISGAEIFIKNVFQLSAFAQGVIVSGVLIGAVVGALSGGRLADRYGRRRVLIVTSIIFGLGSIMSAVATSPGSLIGGRIVVGLAIGLASTTVPVYISEVSPARARGWMVSLFQLAITVGILCAYLVDYAFAASGGWRWMLGLAVVPALIFGLGMIVLPESPRWLAQHGHTDTARDVLGRIRDEEDARKELHEIEDSLKQQVQSGTWAELLGASVRPALIVGVGLAVFQQVTGINTVIYYAPTIIQSAGIPSASGAILATAGIGVVNVLMTIISMRLVDRMGRRPLLLTGILGMAVTLTVFGLAFRLSINGGALAWIAVISLMAYVASFAISLGPIFWLLISEIYPLKIRGLAQGTAATFNWGSNLVVSLLFLPLLEAIGPSWTYLLYALLALAAFAFSYYLVPETKGRTLEQIEKSLNKGAYVEA